MAQQTRGPRSIIAGAKDDAIDRVSQDSAQAHPAGLQCRLERDLSLITGPKSRRNRLESFHLSVPAWAEIRDPDRIPSFSHYIAIASDHCSYGQVPKSLCLLSKSNGTMHTFLHHDPSEPPQRLAATGNQSRPARSTT